MPTFLFTWLVAGVLAGIYVFARTEVQNAFFVAALIGLFVATAVTVVRSVRGDRNPDPDLIPSGRSATPPR